MTLPIFFVAICEFIMREAALFAAIGFLLLGAGDLAVDFIWIGLGLKRRLTRSTAPAASTATFAPAQRPGRLAIFTPAWDESAVIGAMLAHAHDAFGDGPHVHYVGCYPNDPATAAAVWAYAGRRVRLVIGPAPGPTSKADCLNRIWARMIADEEAGIM